MKKGRDENLMHIELSNYITKSRWSSFYHQIFETLQLLESIKGETVLIIGVSDRLVSQILRSIGVKVYSFDKLASLSPDYCGDVAEILKVLPTNFKVDCILCCQVLEHLRFENFERILNQFSRISKAAVISLPQLSYTPLKVSLNLPFIWKKIDFALSIPIFWYKIKKGKKKYGLPTGHHWEIGAKNYQLRVVRKCIEQYFEICKEFKVFESPRHRFFILKQLMV